VSKKNTTKTDDRLVSIADAAAYLGVNVRSVRNMLTDGRLNAYKLGPRVVRLRMSEIDAALEPYYETTA
jgi:excisionase family DNA binding protein